MYLIETRAILRFDYTGGAKSARFRLEWRQVAISLAASDALDIGSLKVRVDKGRVYPCMDVNVIFTPAIFVMPTRKTASRGMESAIFEACDYHGAVATTGGM